MELKFKKVIVTGSSSGLGFAIVEALLLKKVTTAGRVHDIDVFGVSPTCDIRNEQDCRQAAKIISEVDILINNAGINHIDWMENITTDQWDDVMDTNAKGIFNMTKAFLPALLKSKGTILNIISNASHVPMTNSIAYNASKGAAAIMTLQMARELGPKGITVFGISPNKIADTGMSKYIDEAVCDLRGWTPEQAQKYQMAALPAGEETPAESIAEFIAFLLSTKNRHKYLAGTILPYGK